MLSAVRALFPLRAYQIAFEVPFGRKRVDLVCVSRRGKIVAVELKVRDWRRAMRQAVVNQLFAHKAYIAIWNAHAASIPPAILSETGIGLIEIGRSDKAVLRYRAKSQQVRHPQDSARILQYVQRQAGKGTT